MIHEEKIKLRVSDCNAKMEMTASALMEILQEAAGRHCHPLGVSSIQLLESKKVTWIILALSCKSYKSVSWPEDLTIQTWTRTFQGFKVCRDFKIYNIAGELVWEATTQWALIDIEKRSPLKADFLHEVLETESISSSIGEKLPRFSQNLPQESRTSFNFTVNPAHLDMNGHMNNTQYMNQLINHFTAAKNKQLKNFTIYFKKEAKLGDSLEVENFYCDEKGEHIFSRGGDICCTVETHWK